MTVHLNRGSVDIEARGRDLRDVLEEIFQQMDVKYSLPPEVQGMVDVDLHNATFEQALDIILGSVYTYTIGPHDTIYVHCGGTTGKPGWEERSR